MTEAEIIVANGGAVDAFPLLVVSLGSMVAFAVAFLLIINFLVQRTRKNLGMY